MQFLFLNKLLIPLDFEILLLKYKTNIINNKIKN